jgi:hypothetical protein
MLPPQLRYFRSKILKSALDSFLFPSSDIHCEIFISINKNTSEELAISHEISHISVDFRRIISELP